MIKKIFDHKERISSIITFVGGCTILLYIFGYVSETFTWSRLGLSKIPENHIYFLYQGARLIITSFIVFISFLYRLGKHFDFLYHIPLLLSIVSMFIGLFFKIKPAKRKKKSFLLKPYFYLSVSLLLLLICISILFLKEPVSEFNILFSQKAINDKYLLEGYVNFYIFIVGWFIVFTLICYKQIGEQKDDNALSKSTKEDKKRIPRSMKLCNFIKKLSALVSIIMFLYFPIFLGLYSYIGEYPIVKVLYKNEFNEVAPNTLINNDVFALLNESKDSYTLYQRSPRPLLVNIKKDMVSAIIIFKKANIVKLESYDLTNQRDTGKSPPD